jgi:4-hydroxybenzoyl-CoA thioesterase
MTTKMLTNRRNIHIEWGDCDPLGIVYYPRYFEFFDACTNALFEKAGLPKPELLAKYAIAGIPMVETRARFLAPAAFGDTVTVETRVSQWGTSSFSVEHKLFKDGTLNAECFEKRVWTVRTPGDSKKIQSQPIPRDLIEKFSAPT